MLSEFRKNVQAMFARELGIQMFPGLLEGPNTWMAEWVGSVYLRQAQEDPQRVNEMQIFLVARFFAPFSSDSVISPSSPFDPQILEDKGDEILAAIARNQGGLGAWYQRITALEIDPETQGIQATIFAYSSNIGVLP